MAQPGSSPPFPTPTPPPPRKRNWALITLLVVLGGILIVCGGSVAAGYFWVRGVMNQGPPKFDETAVLHKLQLLEPGWAEYRVNALKLKIELPAEMEKSTYEYTEGDRLLFSSYFSYWGSAGDVGVFFDGYRITIAGLYEASDIADDLETIYEEDAAWTDLRLERKLRALPGRTSARVSGTGIYEGEKLAIEALGFMVGGQEVQILVSGSPEEKVKLAAARIERSLKFDGG